MNTIFDRVSRSNENSCTDLLVNLMQVNYIREIIFDFLGLKEIYEKIKPEHISTQQRFEDVGQPDIVIKNDEVCIFVECKISLYTETQKTQYTTYIDEIKKARQPYKKMIYLLPKEYEHPEITAVVEKNDFCSITYWDDVLKVLHDKEVHKWNPIVEHSITHLSELILRKEISISLNREELVMMFNPKELIAAHSLGLKSEQFIAKVEVKIVDILGNDFGHHDWSGCWGNYTESQMGKYLKYKNSPKIFLGYNFELISKYLDKSDFFFSFAIQKDIIKAEKTENYDENKVFPCDFAAEGIWYYFKLDSLNYTDFEHPEKLAEEISTIIKEYVL